MSNKKFSTILMALVAMSFFSPSLSLAQNEEPKAFTPKIKTPDTRKEYSGSEKSQPVEDDPEERRARPIQTSGSPRRLQQHGLGLGLGQTFLMGNYGKHGNDKITLDLLYSYAASYSFDLLVNAHMSEHKDESEKVKLKGLTSSIKGRLVEFDNFSPYFLGGLGFYAPQFRRAENGSTKWSTQKVTFGLNFGGGVDLRLNDNYVIGVMAQVHWPFRIEQEGQSDVKGYYSKLLITGMYLF
jgi:hypothetical protein